MRMNGWKRSILLGGVVGWASMAGLGCRGKACDSVPPSETATSLGIVLDGGHLCEEDRNVASIDYPKADGGKALASLYKSTLGKAGWKVEVEAGMTLLLTRADDTLFIITTDKTKQRGLPWAAVRYCRDSGCRRELTALANAMKERAK
jgi:hypothetical protein